MATLREGNGLNYRSFLDVRATSKLKTHKEPETATMNIVQIENSGVSDISPSFDSVQSNDSCAPVLDIVINNVVCSFNLRCHLNLKHIALNGYNVEYRRENGMVTMKLRKPSTTASIWSSGKITCTGATSNADAKKASRRFARMIQQLGFKVKFTNFRVVNVLGTCTLPFAVKISQFSTFHRQNASYEPELHPGVTYKIKELKATLKIFSTGNITITAPSITNVQSAVEHVFPLVYEFRKDRPLQIKSLDTPKAFHQHSNQMTNIKVEEKVDVETALDNLGEVDMHNSNASWD